MAIVADNKDILFNPPEFYMKRHILLMLICLSVKYAFASSVDHTAPISLSALQAIDIRHYVQDQEINILSLDDHDYLTLEKEETTGFPRGIAFIVPEINQPITQQPAIKMLYDNLTEYGWRSLLLTMPNLEQNNGSLHDVPKADTEESPSAPDVSQSPETSSTLPEEPGQEMAASNDSQTTAEPNLNIKAFHQEDIYSEVENTKIEQEILKRVETAWQYAEQFPGYFIFICQGKSCAWLTSLFQQQKLMQPDALVMLSAHMPQSNLNRQFAQQLSETEFPVLELFKPMDNQWVTSAIHYRKKLARKNYKTDYRQRKLNSHVAFGDSNLRTVKEIYGFLTAVGM
ncbi:DUF3530 family protein [Psychrosphaera aquimarina]|uniref:DUF3530 family protein n=2 Tax=Psychrosphaera TaxID=907197 RepID=A0ABU3R474_9GAMM|nr:DUF3530 family protein [Psychrosphaera aquimarina]MDU0114469.1 DUF3530 family protein [Psychrosphaera aquimarina]